MNIPELRLSNSSESFCYRQDCMPIDITERTVSNSLLAHMLITVPSTKPKQITGIFNLSAIHRPESDATSLVTITSHDAHLNSDLSKLHGPGQVPDDNTPLPLMQTQHDAHSLNQARLPDDRSSESRPAGSFS
jgi:hypothetical protein